MKILIVEDNPVNAEMIRFSLEKEQYEPILAADGEEALACLDAHPDIAVVVTDVMMPGMDGMQMLQRIRERPECKSLPVVVATSLANQATVRRAVSLQCKHFIVKPFTVSLLLQEVREALGQRGMVLEDKAHALVRLGIDTAGYDRLALTFASFVHARVSTLQELAGQESPPEIDETLTRDLFALEECAKLLGAERLIEVLTSFGLPGGSVPAESRRGIYKALLNELRALAGVLPAPTPTEPTPAAEPPPAG
jgi:CheY-like chemotaxis protein